MSNKIIVDKRRSGKTTKAIEESASTGKYILVANRDMALSISKLAHELGVHIPFPITIKEWEAGVARSVKERGIIVDEGLVLLEKILGTQIHMITISERDHIPSDAHERQNNLDDDVYYFLRGLNWKGK